MSKNIKNTKNTKNNSNVILKPSKQTTLTTIKNPTENVYWTIFEPKSQNRFVCKITEAGTNNSIIPSYVIRGINRPSGNRVSGKWDWSPMSIKFFDPINPSTTQSLYESFIQKNQLVDVEIKVLGPVGDLVEEWLCKNAEVTSINLDTLNWNDGGTPLEITIIIKPENVVLKD
jgi:hypothetical protein